MKIVTIHEAKTHLSRLIREAVEGEEIVIARGTQPLVRLTPVQPEARTRTLGTAKGKVRIAAEFDEPIDDFTDDSHELR
ncbi:MAG: type II toxin-antitoxin system prevent-host-death family antitoxin [Acidobacteria bacterium]|nr:MAG: type II toxin-antitoxin system prevent-host-death family antitoxin [Acidobacteriota bacterium]REK00871.1 MAG: type II toxin-antitoxin system prevent-host-death family antitoxin [Acidobacteriota bacterium]